MAQDTKTTAVRTVKPTKVLPAAKHVPFQMIKRTVPNKHKVRVTVDYGPGPWAIVGINDTVYGVGYIPKNKRK